MPCSGAATWARSDAGSGIDGCTVGIDGASPVPSATPTSHTFPDVAVGPHVIAVTCTDVAGNLGTAKFSLEYDATPPTLLKLRVKPGNRKVTLVWAASADTQNIRIIRAPGAHGRAKSTIYRGHAASYRDTGLTIGKGYRYTVTAFDRAGNAATRRVTLTATGRLLSPVPGARVSSAPLFVWMPFTGARYYNLQLVRGEKILSIWTRRTRFRLPRSWTFEGTRYDLSPGVYRWYVWPGFGRVSASNYGRLLGGSSFTVGAASVKHG